MTPRSRAPADDDGGRDVPSLPPDHEIVARMRQGDVRLFENLYHATAAPLYNFAFRYLQSADDAEEVVQEVFMRVWRDRAAWVVNGSVHGYLYLAVRNQAIDRLKRYATARRWRDAVRAESQTVVEPVLNDDMLQAADLNAAMERVLAEMPVKRRGVCALRWTDGLSYAEIADRLGISERSVELHIGRGLKAMREHLRTGEQRSTSLGEAANLRR